MRSADQARLSLKIENQGITTLVATPFFIPVAHVLHTTSRFELNLMLCIISIKPRTHLSLTPSIVIVSKLV